MLNEKAVAFRLLFLVYRPNYILISVYLRYTKSPIATAMGVFAFERYY